MGNTKIRVFRFPASRNKFVRNGERTFLCERLNTSDVEAEINDFMQYHNIISVNVNTVDCRYHNNGGYNDVDIVYTIVYQD